MSKLSDRDTFICCQTTANNLDLTYLTYALSLPVEKRPQTTCLPPYIPDHGRPQDFFQGGQISVWGRKTPSKVQEWSPSKDLGTKTPEADDRL